MIMECSTGSSKNTGKSNMQALNSGESECCVANGIMLCVSCMVYLTKCCCVISFSDSLVYCIEPGNVLQKTTAAQSLYVDTRLIILRSILEILAE